MPSEIEDLDRYRRDVERVAARILGTGQAVDDVVQETYLTAIRRTVDHDRNPRGWLMRIARNFALKELRSRRRRARHEAGTDQADEPPSPERTAAGAEAHQMVTDALDTLDEGSRVALTMRFVQDLPYAEIGTRLGIGEDAARSRVRRGLQTLRKRLKGRDPRLGPVAAFVASCIRFLRRHIRRVALLGACALVLTVLWRARSEPASVRQAEASVANADAGRAPVAAPDPDPPASPDDDPNRVPGPDITLRGRVLHAGRAVPGARVRAMRAYPRYAPLRDNEEIASATADPDGRFAMRVPRRYRLSVEADATRADVAPISRLVAVPPAGDPTELVLHLPRPTPLRGVVVDPTGNPIAGAEVEARQGDYFRSWIVRRQTTSADGRFRFRLKASDLHLPIDLTVRAPGYGRLLYRVLDRAQRGSRPDLRLAFLDGARVAGTVRDASGTPVPGARVVGQVDRSQFLFQFPTATTDAEGRYEMVAPALPLRFLVTKPPASAPELARTNERADLDLRPGLITTRDVVLQRGVAVTGIAIDRSTGAPVPRARIVLHSTAFGGDLSFAGSTTTDETGRFRFDNVSRGRYALEAFAGFRARIVNRQGVTADVGFDFAVAESSPPPQHVELGPCGAVVVRFALGRPPPNLGGRSREDPATWRILLRTGSIAQGAACDPTDFVTFPWVPETDGAQLHGFAVRRPLVPPFRVDAGRVTEVVVHPPEPKLTVAVRVEDGAGAPVPDAAVGIYPATTPDEEVARLRRETFPPPGSRRTASDGTCHFLFDASQAERLARGAFAAAAHPGFELARKAAPATRDDRWELEFVLRKGTRIRGIVMREGKPVPRANVWVHADDESAELGGAPTPRAKSGADGTFAVSGLSAKSYRVWAATDHWMSSTAQVTPSDTVVRLDVGTRPLVSVTGSLRTCAGEPVEEATLVGSDGAASWSTTVRAGAWSTRVPAGAWSVAAVLQHRGYPYARTSAGTVYGKPGRADLVLPQHARRSGHVVDAAGTGIAEATVGILSPKDTVLATSLTASDGTFELPPVSPGTRILAFAAARAIRIAEVPPHAELLSIGLAPERVLSGVVQNLDGSPLGGAVLRVLAVPPEPKWTDALGATDGEALVRTTRTDGQGRFRFGQLGDARYVLRFVQAPKGRALAAPPAAPVRDIAIRVVPTRGLTGRIAGRTFARGSSVVARVHGVEFARTGVDGTGAFEFTALPATPLDLELVVSGIAVGTTRVGPADRHTIFELR